VIWGKRVVLFVLVNLLVLVSISLMLQVLNVGPYLGARGIDYGSLLAFCLAWGMAGAFISLAMSRATAKWSMGVRLIDESSGHALPALIRRLTERAGVPMPEVGVYQSPEPNAFATGPSRSRALIAVSTSLLESLTASELEGVLGHEVSHIANGDMVTMTLLQGVVNAFVMFFARVIAFALSRDSDRDTRHVFNYMTVLLLEIVLGFFGMIVVAWFSRRREFRADAGGVRLNGREKMLAALEALRRGFQPHDPQQTVAALKIAGRPGRGFLALIATHPPLEERIAALRKGTDPLG
jgi:heat shock protein HtpX